MKAYLLALPLLFLLGCATAPTILLDHPDASTVWMTKCSTDKYTPVCTVYACYRTPEPLPEQPPMCLPVTYPKIGVVVPSHLRKP
jgi:hypothetical protein